MVLLNSVYQLLKYIINERLKKMWSRQTCWNMGKVEAGKAKVSTATCRNCISSQMKQTGKTKESTESTLISEMLSMVCHRMRFGV